jgi:Beta-propeller repeat
MVRLTLSVLVVLVVAGCGSADRHADVRPSVAGLPLTFVENRGQTDARVRFHAQGPGHGFYLTREEIALTLQRDSGEGVSLALRFLGADPALVSGARRAPGAVNYLRGDGPAVTGVPHYEEVTYRDLWPGIDLALSGRDGALKYEFRVAPGARPTDIRLAYRGADQLRRDGSGGLSIDTALGELRDAPPVAWQEVGAARVPVDSRYALHGDRGYGFAVGDYDRSRELIIDPSLAYSTFLGGTSHEFGSGIAVDGAGNAYVTGFTQSPNFPTTTGAFDRTGAASNNLDAFVTKLNPSGSAVVYSTFLGGSAFDWGRGIALDAAGSAYVTGRTMSSNFPTTSGAFDRSFNVDDCPRCGIDQADAFVAKLSPAGSSLVYSTFVGGTSPDDAFGIALDGARNAYFTGETTSGNFPTTGGAFDRTAGGGSDGFVAKLNAAGSALVYSTRLGGADNDLPEGVAVDAAGNATVGGSTRSADFPTTPGAFDSTHNGGAIDERFDLFATKLNAAGSGLVFSTFVGGSRSDFGADLAVDGAGNSYLAGGTLSPDFPITPGAFDGTFAGSEGFAIKLNPAGSGLVYATFLGSAGAAAVAPDADGDAWLAGGSGPGAPTTPGAFANYGGGASDAYVAELSADGAELRFASFLGGSESEGGDDVALDPGGDVYVSGHTYSADFPTTPGAFDRVFGGDTMIFWGDAFVTKLDTAGTSEPPPPPPPPLAAPSLVAPAAGAQVGQPATFDWTDVEGAAAYTIQVDEISDFGAPLVLSASPTASQLTTSSLPDSPWMWFWRVRAVAADGTPGAWSEVRTIRVQSEAPPSLSAPTLISPSNDARFRRGRAIAFDWGDVAGAADYTIQIDDSQSFSAPVVAGVTTGTSAYTTSTLPARRLWWRVRANDGSGGAGPWSSTRRFEVRN